MEGLSVFPAAANYPSALTALRSVGPLDGLHEYDGASASSRQNLVRNAG